MRPRFERDPFAISMTYLPNQTMHWLSPSRVIISPRTFLYGRACFPQHRRIRFIIYCQTTLLKFFPTHKFSFSIISSLYRFPGLRETPCYVLFKPKTFQIFFYGIDRKMHGILCTLILPMTAPKIYYQSLVYDIGKL